MTADDWFRIATNDIGLECDFPVEPVLDEDIDRILVCGGQPLCWLHEHLLAADLHLLHDGRHVPLPPEPVPGDFEPAPGASLAGVCQALQLSGGLCMQPPLIVSSVRSTYLSLLVGPHHALVMTSWLRAQNRLELGESP